jgi:hypothetical protein
MKVRHADNGTSSGNIWIDGVFLPAQTLSAFSDRNYESITKPLKCESCGAPMKNNIKCEYCGTIYSTEFLPIYDDTGKIRVVKL